MRPEFPDVRLGNVRATNLTRTLTERLCNAVERIPAPQRLVAWPAVYGRGVAPRTTAWFDLAREPREAIRAAATVAS